MAYSVLFVYIQSQRIKHHTNHMLLPLRTHITPHQHISLIFKDTYCTRSISCQGHALYCALPLKLHTALHQLTLTAHKQPKPKQIKLQIQSDRPIKTIYRKIKV
jgi:hypothetical protein